MRIEVYQTLSLIEERTFGLDKRHFSITAFGVPETEINSDYILALSELVQYIYITDDDLPNPYDTFSSYIDELFAILSQQADELIIQKHIKNKFLTIKAKLYVIEPVLHAGLYSRQSYVVSESVKESKSFTIIVPFIDIKL